MRKILSLHIQRCVLSETPKLQAVLKVEIQKVRLFQHLVARCVLCVNNIIVLILT